MKTTRYDAASVSCAGLKDIATFKEKAEDLAQFLEAAAPLSARARAIALTQLELAVYAGVRAISLDSKGL